MRPPEKGPNSLNRALFHFFYFHMGLNCPTEVQTQFPIFFENTPLRDHCALLCCSFGVMSLLWFIYLLQYFFDALHLRCIASLVLCICTFGMLCIGIFAVHNRWCAATLVNYILVAIFLWCYVSLVHCIFGVMYMHFWYAMQRHLWWCLVGAITSVQCVFGALFLVLGAIHFWCCIFGAMHCQLYRAGLLPQWRIYGINKPWKMSKNAHFLFGEDQFRSKIET